MPLPPYFYYEWGQRTVNSTFRHMRLSPIINICFYAATSLVLLLIPAFRVFAAGERVEIPIAKYSGRDEYFDQFRSALKDWVLTMTEEIQDSGKEKELEYLRRVRLIDRPLTDFATAADLERFWKKTDTLQVLQGSIASEGKGYFIRTRIYMGELQGQFPRPSILIEIPFEPRQYSASKNSHMAVLFYCLAMDAERVDPKRHPFVMSLLKQAKDKIENLKKDKMLIGSLAELDLAIQHSEKRLRRR